jgi:DNA-binding transcriptional ArsR family regulator
MQSITKKTEFTPEVLQIAKIAKALSHPARVYIVKKLSTLNACCYSGDLVDELPIGRSALSQHLKELKFAGLIQGETEPPYIKYCLNKENWKIAKAMFGELLGE